MFPLVEASANITSPVTLTFKLYWADTTIGHNNSPKNPPEAPTAYLDGHTLSLSGSCIMGTEFLIRFSDVSLIVPREQGI